MQSENTSKKELLYIIAKRTAAISAVFAVVLSILLIANTIQTHSIDPLNSQALNELMRQLQENPQDAALQQQIRALDLLARKAYFTHQWQLRTGGLLLFVSVLVLLISLKYISSLRPQLPDFSQAKQENSWETKLLARRYIIYSGLGIFLVAFLLSVFSQTQLKERRVKASFASMREMRDNWPSFRGPDGLGLAYHTDVLTIWNGESGENIKWKVPVAKQGLNSPIIWKKKIFLSGADEESQEVYCYDADSGELLWTTELNDIPGSPKEAPDVTEDTGYAAPTMATDGERVYVIFATGDLACLDFDGERVWVKNLGMPDNHYGHSSSLFTFKHILLVQYDTNEEKHLMGFHGATGEQLYATPREDMQISWASPVVVQESSEARDQVILSTTPYVIGYDPANGQELWRVNCMDAEVGPSVAYADGWVYAANEYAQLAAIKLEGTAHIAWEYEDDLPEASSPVATPSFLVMASSYGTVSCFDAKSGDVYWTQEFDEGFYSSPIVVGENVFVMDRDGVMHIFELSKEFTAVAANELGERSDTVPAFMHGRIYIRGEEHLFCIGN